MEEKNNQQNTGGAKSTEILAHFSCISCDKWWSIGDAPEDKKEWFCPWCGEKQEF